MKKLGKIFKKYSKSFFAVLVIVLLFLVKPWKWFSLENDGSKTGLIAKRLFDSMQGFGTKEKDLFEALEGLSKFELNEVYSKFGLRYYNRALGIQSGSFIGQKYDLFTWFFYELNKKEKAQMRKIWAVTGREITF